MGINSNIDSINPVRIFRGESKTFELSVVDGDEQPVNLTGARIFMSIKNTLGELTAVIMKDSDVAGDVDFTNPTGGVVRINFSPTDTDSKTVKQYVYDIWVILASGKRHVVVDPSQFFIDLPVSVIA